MNTSAIIVNDPGLVPAIPPDAWPGYHAIARLFDYAVARRLKHPKITVQTSDGTVVVLRVAGEKSNYEGEIQIVGEGSFYERAYYGRIDHDGQLHGTSELTDSIEELLFDLDSDPLQFAFKYGKTTGNCCFCDRPLTDPRSAAHGYGRVCAGHYGLPWDADRKNRGFVPCESGDGSR